MKLSFSLIVAVLGLFSSAYGYAASKASAVDPIVEVFEPAGTYPADQYVKIAVISSKQDKGVDVTNSERVQKYKADNSKALEVDIRKAKENKARFVMTPEYGIAGYPQNKDYNYQSKEEVKYVVEPIPGTTTNFFSNLAAELQIYLSINMLEVDSETQKYYNTQVVFDPQGKILAKHRKVNLYGTEGRFLASGTKETIITMPWGRVGFLVCADTYQILLLHKYLGKADHLFVSASWTSNDGWRYFKAASALTRTNYIISNQSFFPDTGIINANGSEQSHIRQTEGLAYGYLKYTATR